MAITDWPMAERPREKLLSLGAQALSEAELLAIFLRSGVRGKTAVDLARELLIEFNGLRNLLQASKHEFCKSHGLGAAKYAQLQAILEMNRRHLRGNLGRQSALRNSQETKGYLLSRLRDRPREIFAGLFLDIRHRILHYEEIFLGTIDSAHVYPREVVKCALQHNAAAVVLAHNHPSGVVEPSLADKEITQRLVKALQLVDVQVLDHMIVGETEVLSFAEEGLL